MECHFHDDVINIICILLVYSYVCIHHMYTFDFIFCFLSRICLVGEKPDKELPGIVGARGDTV